MYGSNWGKFNKAGLAIGAPIALLSAGLLGWASSWSVEYERQADNYTQEYTANGARKIGEACNVLAPVEKANCLIDAQSKARENERAEQDLVAQRQSALWAYVMALAAVIGMALSALGVFLVWTTFRATKQANLIAREAFEAGARAWVRTEVNFGSVIFAHDTVSVRVRVTCVNQGASPATFLSVAPTILIGEDWTSPRIFNWVPKAFDIEQPEGWNDVTLFPGEEWYYTCLVESTNVPEGLISACLVLPVRYNTTNLTGSPHFTVNIFDCVRHPDHEPQVRLVGDVQDRVVFIRRPSMASAAW